MADDGLNNLEESAGTEAPAKKAGPAGFLLIILKWIAIGIAAIIVIVLIVVLVVKQMNKNNGNANNINSSASEEYTTKKEVLDWYTSLDEVRVNLSGDVHATLTIQVALGYKQQDKATSSEITQRSVELKDFLRSFFSQKTAVELEPQNEGKLKIELRNAINDSILANSKIRDIAFTRLDVLKS